MRQALFQIWLRWAVWVTLFSIISALFVACGITVILYVMKGAVSLEGDVLDALGDIVWFWFGVCWSITLPLGTFLGMKQLFLRCSRGYRLQLFTCNLERIERVHYNDLIKAWRKWLFLTIWSVAVGILLIATLQWMLYGSVEISKWLHSYVLYALVMLSSWATLTLMIRRCPAIEMERCYSM